MLSCPLQVIKAASLTQYRDALKRWEEEKERQQEEFTITDKNLPESPAALIDKVLSQIQSHTLDSDVFFSVFTLCFVAGTCSSSSEKRTTTQKIQGGSLA